MRGNLALLAVLVFGACDSAPPPLTDEERAAIADTAKTLVQGVFASVNNRNLEEAFAVYSPDADARFVQNGASKTFAALKKDQARSLAKLERLRFTPASMDVVVLAPDMAVVSSAYRMSATPNGRKPFYTTGAASFVVQRRDDKWVVVQSHESTADAVGLSRAIASAKAKPSAPKAPAKKPVVKTAARKK